MPSDDPATERLPDARRGGAPARLDRRLVGRRFDRAAATLGTAGFVHEATREGLLARLAPMTLEPARVLDLGCATGEARRPLEKRFRGALVIGCDLSMAMLDAAGRRRGPGRLFRKPPLVAADALALPFAGRSIDLVFANLLLPWIDDPGVLFAEINRVLERDGLLVFATLGPDSLGQLRDAWREVDDAAHVHPFIDMHDLGDAAVRAGLKDPVLDVDRLEITYGEPAALFADLAHAGARNCLVGRPPGLTGRERYARFVSALEARRREGVLPITLEIVYGHCWGSGQTAESGEFLIDPTRIGRRLR